MSGTSTSGSNGTTILSGPDVIQLSDFWVKAGVLHPVTVGSVAVIALFICLRVGSNRSIAPITVFDWLINVALGSTLAGIVNGNNLVRGLLSLATMLSFQYVTSMLSTRFDRQFGWVFASPPLVIVFRGSMLTKVMLKHRISCTDVYAALREQGVLSICLVECAIIEPNGTFSVVTMKQVKEANHTPDVLMAVRAYKALCDQEKGPYVDKCAAAGHKDAGYGGHRYRQSGKKDAPSASPNMDHVANECC